MSQIENASPNLFSSRFFILTTVIMAAIAVGLAGISDSMAPLGVVIFLYLVVLLFKWPDFNVILIVFIIYTNTAVVMSKFQGMPQAVGYALPLLLLIPLIWHLFVHKRKIKINIVFVLMMLYLSVMIIGSVYSRDINLAMPNVINYVVEGLMLYFLLLNTIRTPKLLKQVVWSLLIAGALMGGLSLYQQITGTFDNNYGGFAQIDTGFIKEESIQGKVIQPRIAGPVGEINRYAQVMSMLVPLGLFQAWGARSKMKVFAALILTGLIIVGATLSFSRGAQVGFLILVITMALMRYIKIRELLIMLGALVLLLISFPQISQRFLTLGNIFSSQEEGGIRNTDGSIQGRATEMLAALLVFVDHPIIGVGPGMFRYEMEEKSRIISLRNITGERQAHSLYPGVAAESGILGFTALMGIFFYTLYRLNIARAYWLERNQAEMANLCAGFFLAIISYMTTGIFLHLSFIRYLWLMVALAVIASEFRGSDVPAEMDVAGKELYRSDG